MHLDQAARVQAAMQLPVVQAALRAQSGGGHTPAKEAAGALAEHKRQHQVQAPMAAQRQSSGGAGGGGSQGGSPPDGSKTSYLHVVTQRIVTPRRLALGEDGLPVACSPTQIQSLLKQRMNSRPTVYLDASDIGFPAHWIILERVRASGQTTGTRDRYFLTPNGGIIRSKQDALKAAGLVPGGRPSSGGNGIRGSSPGVEAGLAAGMSVGAAKPQQDAISAAAAAVREAVQAANPRLRLATAVTRPGSSGDAAQVRVLAERAGSGQFGAAADAGAAAAPLLIKALGSTAIKVLSVGLVAWYKAFWLVGSWLARLHLEWGVVKYTLHCLALSAEDGAHVHGSAGMSQQGWRGLARFTGM